MAVKRKVVCVIGASSQLGVFLLPRLRQAGFRVLALGRDAPLRPYEVADGVTWLKAAFLVDGERGDQVMRQPPPQQLVSCGPLELAQRLVLRYPGLQRVVAFSSSSVLSKADSEDRAERRRMATMAADEEALTAACAERGLPLLLLRPTLIYGCGMDRNVSLLAGLARRFGMIPLAGPAAGLRQPVHAADLAELAVRALQAERPLDTASAVCGGSTLSYRGMAQCIADVQARPVRLLSLPEGLMVALVRALSMVPRAPGVNAEMVRRQNQDLVFDDHALRLALDWTPRPFELTPADFEVPEHCRALQLPQGA
jgi:NAD(P)-dependent dehydrogenase (short-subunit alcohol dehydrogenase family)